LKDTSKRECRALNSTSTQGEGVEIHFSKYDRTIGLKLFVESKCKPQDFKRSQGISYSSEKA